MQIYKHSKGSPDTWLQSRVISPSVHQNMSCSQVITRSVCMFAGVPSYLAQGSEITCWEHFMFTSHMCTYTHTHTS